MVAKQKKASSRRRTVTLLLAPSLLVMITIFALPMLLFFNYSFYTYEKGRLIDDFTFSSYVKFFTDPYYYKIVLASLKLAGISTLIALLIGYPLAYTLHSAKNSTVQKWMTVIIFSPLLVSVVVRTYGWLVLLSDQGIVNYLLLNLGIVQERLRLALNFTGVVIGLSHIFLPFMVFPIYSVLFKLDPSLKEASNDLGAGWWRTFTKVTLPLSLPGIIAGVQLCFTLSMGAFVTPSLLGGGRVLVLPTLIYRNVEDINWPLGSVASMSLLLLAILAVMIFDRVLKRYTPAQ
jgi:putative spermidine/putrescine transport system permease protein